LPDALGGRPKDRSGRCWTWSIGASRSPSWRPSLRAWMGRGANPRIRVGASGWRAGSPTCLIATPCIGPRCSGAGRPGERRRIGPRLAAGPLVAVGEQIGQLSPAERLTVACVGGSARNRSCLTTPARVGLFGLTRMLRSYLDVLAAIAGALDVHQFVLHCSLAVGTGARGVGRGSAGDPPSTGSDGCVACQSPTRVVALEVIAHWASLGRPRATNEPLERFVLQPSSVPRPAIEHPAHRGLVVAPPDRCVG
jgi:hypothetical protein